MLVERAKNDKEAFAELYDKYCPQILGYVIKRTANIEVAQDVTSQVFFKALKNIGQFHWRGVPFSSWLYKIASNEITNYYRERKRRRKYLENNYNLVETSNPSPESELTQAQEELRKHEEFISVHENISKLSFKYQEVITLRYFEHKHLKEIEAILGKSEGTVKSLLYRGLKNLRKLME
jgi:RNA polymerase sigma-70 factor (ECF subfamily)